MKNEGKNSILIVDDDKLQVEALAFILREEYTIYAAKNGENAIEIAQRNLPDLIILDVVMGEMDGFETLSRLKSHTTTCDIPVIFISGLNADEDQIKGLEMDIVDYITKPFSQRIVKLRVRNQIKIINQMRALERMSRIDQLTDIPNRRYFTERIYIEWKLSIRTSRPLSILIIDIDHFKNYNDTYGHLQGDEALKQAAHIITRRLRRASDFGARYGGEEFIVMLPDTDDNGAMKVAEDIRCNIESAVIPVLMAEGKTSEIKATKITASIGTNTIIPKVDDSLDFFISCADSALYISKNSGRNKVNAYAPLN